MSIIGIFAEAFRGQKRSLSTSIIITEDLLIQLLDARIINDDEYERINTQYGMTSKVIQLLDYLQRTSSKFFVPFCKIMVNTGHNHVVEMMLNNIPSTMRVIVDPQITG